MNTVDEILDYAIDQEQQAAEENALERAADSAKPRFTRDFRIRHLAASRNY